jgi:hypothetical protein
VSSPGVQTHVKTTLVVVDADVMALLLYVERKKDQGSGEKEE